MVIIGSWYLLIAVAVFVVWRIVCWRRNGTDWAREGVVALLFLWSLAVAWVTFFPMTIIFYSWHESFSLVPFASIIQLLQQADALTAFKNIVGNILLFIPFGVLLPILFERLRRVWPLVWRVAVISVAIEAVQTLTKVRATDIDDIILNLVGAMLGLSVFKTFQVLSRRSRRLTATLERLGSRSRREPLLIGLVPVGVSLLLIAAAIIPTVVSQTLSESAIIRPAETTLQQASVVARADVGGYAFLLAEGSVDDSEMLRFSEYKQVLPGRYVLTAETNPEPARGSGYSAGLTAYDPTAGEVPVLCVWGRNASSARWLVVHASYGFPEQKVAIGEYFMVAVVGSVDVRTGIRFDYGISFLDASGRDVTDDFVTW